MAIDDEEIKMLLEHYARKNTFRYNQKTHNSYMNTSHPCTISKENPQCNDVLTIHMWIEGDSNTTPSYAYEGSFCSLVTIATEELLEYLKNTERISSEKCIATVLLVAQSNTLNIKKTDIYDVSLLPKIFTSVFLSLSLQRRQCFLLPYHIIDIIYKKKEQ